MTRAQLAFAAIACFASSFALSVCRAEQAIDETAIRDRDKAYVEAYNNRDAKAISALWSPEAIYVDPETGEEAIGRDQIEKEFADTFANLKDAKLEIDVSSIQFFSPNVAVENGTARIILPNAEPDESAYSALFVKRDGEWLLDRVTEVESSTAPLEPPSNYEHLKELEWMIGSWIDRDDDSTVQTDCEWTKNQSFINRSFAVVVKDQVDMAGMQFIGWDPVTKQIRSWIFDSDGGYSEGRWTRNGNRWLIKQNGTLPDGQSTSAINIIKRVDDDSFTWQSVQREVGGDLLPNVDEVLVVRKSSE